MEAFIRRMPKVELHVHLEGAIRPETLLKLAQRNNIELPANDLDGLHQWYRFTSFDHFIEIYLTLSRCICNADDIELIAREFLEGQAAQNILYSEVTYTAQTHLQNHGISYDDQFAALERARSHARDTLGVTMNMVVDIARQVSPEEGIEVANAAVSAMDRGVIALGLGGPEIGNPPEKFREAFAIAHAAGLPSVPHAGEVAGAESIRGALDALHAVRIGHGVRCLDDPELVAELKRRQIPLEVCPTSNLCLKIFPDMKSHNLPRLIEEGLYVTINSDDPPMFNTTLTNEFEAICSAFGYGEKELEGFLFRAVAASLLPEAEKQALEQRCRQEWEQCRTAG